MIVSIESRGDDINCFQDILKYIPMEREDLKSYICYLRNEFAEQIGYDMRQFDIGLWSDDEIKEYLIK